jgi:hypothetical protein
MKKKYNTHAERQKAYRLRKGQKARTILKGIVVSHPHREIAAFGLLVSWNVRLPNGNYVNLAANNEQDVDLVEQFFKESRIPREPFKARWKEIL